MVEKVWNELLDGDDRFVIEEGIDLGFVEEHFFIRVEKVDVDLLILFFFPL